MPAGDAPLRAWERIDKRWWRRKSPRYRLLRSPRGSADRSSHDEAIRKSLRIIEGMMVPEVGLEPTCPFGRWILNPVRLPFHHSGTGRIYSVRRGLRQELSASLRVPCALRGLRAFGVRGALRRMSFGPSLRTFTAITSIMSSMRRMGFTSYFARGVELLSAFAAV